MKFFGWHAVFFVVCHAQRESSIACHWLNFLKQFTLKSLCIPLIIHTRTHSHQTSFNSICCVDSHCCQIQSKYLQSKYFIVLIFFGKFHIISEAENGIFKHVRQSDNSDETNPKRFSDCDYTFQWEYHQLSRKSRITCLFCGLVKQMYGFNMPTNWNWYQSYFWTYCLIVCY